MRTVCIVLTFGLLCTALSHAQLRVIGAGDTLSVDTTGFPSEMRATYDLMVQKCSRCHTIERVIVAVQSGVLPLSKQKFSADTTRSLVGRMFLKPDANITRGEARKIAELLGFLLKAQSEPAAVEQEQPPPKLPAVIQEPPPEPGPVVASGQESPRNAESPRVASIRQAAEAGDRDGQVALGWLYSSGDEVTPDKGEAVKWYKRAAEQGDLRAQLALGWLYYAGDGVKRDLREAARWYEKAAAQGSDTARKKLADIRMMVEQEENTRGILH
jgi:hypothetical protein